MKDHLLVEYAELSTKLVQMLNLELVSSAHLSMNGKRYVSIFDLFVSILDLLGMESTSS